MENVFKEEVEYAGFWVRFVASFIDGLILIIPNLLLIFLIEDQIIESIVSYIAFWPYYAIMESGESQATIGKKVMKIKVTNINGERVTFKQASIRYFAKIISTIIFLIGYIIAAFTSKKQALHDLIAETLVLKVEE
ncbi:MAG: RDD family protein [Flammeovirgaceae bacterium]